MNFASSLITYNKLHANTMKLALSAAQQWFTDD
jgi:hypothetical protein